MAGPRKPAPDDEADSVSAATATPTGRYAEPRRRPLPDSEALRTASKLARQRERALERAEALYDELRAAVADMRAAGYSHAEIAETIGVTKARAQQLVSDARERGLLPPDPERPDA